MESSIAFISRISGREEKYQNLSEKMNSKMISKLLFLQAKKCIGIHALLFKNAVNQKCSFPKQNLSPQQFLTYGIHVLDAQHDPHAA